MPLRNPPWLEHGNRKGKARCSSVEMVDGDPEEEARGMRRKERVVEGVPWGFEWQQAYLDEPRHDGKSTVTLVPSLSL